MWHHLLIIGYDYAWLAYDDENNAMFQQNIALFGDWNPGKECVRDRKAGPVKSLAD